MTKRLRTCQVGCGYWGPNLLRNVAANTKAELAGICELDPATLERFGERHPGATLFKSFEDVLADDTIEAVVLATPSSLHAEQARLALEAGKHAMVEKPLAETAAEALALAELSEAKGLTLMVGHTFLYNNIVHEVKRRIDAGELGEVYYAYSQRLNLGRFRNDSDVMWTLAPHDISIFNYLFDGTPRRASARGHAFVHRRRAPAVAEVCFAQLDYPDGKSAHLHLSWLDPQKRRDMIIVGAERMLVYDDMNPDAHIRIYDKKAEAEHQGAMEDFADFTTRVRAGDLVVPNIRLAEPLAAEIDHFIDCVLTGVRPRTDARHAGMVTAVMVALEASMKADGTPLEIDYGGLAPTTTTQES